MHYTRPMTLAWLAALIDGEGSVMLNTRTEQSRKRGIYVVRPMVIVSNCDIRMMDALVERTGIRTVYEQKRPERAQHKSRSYTWRMNVEQIREWGPALVPHLVCKREQMELLLEALELKAVAANPATRVAGHQERIRDIQMRIQELNRRGRFKEEVGPK